MKFTITGRIPSKKNSKTMICRGRRPMLIPSQKHKEWHEDAVLQVRQQKILPSEPSTVIMKFYFPDKRKADLTNKAESIMDLLVDTKILPDDNWQVIPCIQLEGYLDRDNPRCEVTFI